MATSSLAIKHWLASLQTMRLKKAVFLSEPDDVHRALKSKEKGRQFILCGSQAYASVGRVPPPDAADHVEQMPRPRAQRDFKEKSGLWHLWIPTRTLKSRLEKKGSVFVAQDQYIHYGQVRSKALDGRVVLVGGMAGIVETNIEIYVFDKGVLTAIEERMLDESRDSLRATQGYPLVELIERRVEELTSGHDSQHFKLLIAAPLDEYKGYQTLKDQFLAEYVGKTPFSKLLALPFESPKEEGSLALVQQVKLWALPALIAAGGVGFSVNLVQSAHQDYLDTVQQYRTVAQRTADIDAGYLNQLESRSLFLQETDLQADLSYFQTMSEVLSSVSAMNGVYITRARILGAPASRTEAMQAASRRGRDVVPDLQVVMALPLPENYSGSLRDHSREALSGLAAAIQNPNWRFQLSAFSHQRVEHGQRDYNQFELRVVRSERNQEREY